MALLSIAVALRLQSLEFNNQAIITKQATGLLQLLLPGLYSNSAVLMGTFNDRITVLRTIQTSSVPKSIKCLTHFLNTPQQVAFWRLFKHLHQPTEKSLSLESLLIFTLLLVFPIQKVLLHIKASSIFLYLAPVCSWIITPRSQQYSRKRWIHMYHHSPDSVS